MAVARTRGESSATEKLHPAVHQHERERERHGSDGDRLGRAEIEGTPGQEVRLRQALTHPFILPLHSSTPSRDPSCSSLILRYLGAFFLVTSVMPVLILGSMDLPLAAFVASWTPTFPIA